ncbi:MAG: glutamate 5-kinase [Pseudomonadota bacterium]
MTISAPFALETARRIVVKTGSALIATDGAPRTDWLAGLASDIAILRGRGLEVLLVTSGAIALGRDALGPDRPRKLEDKQAAAAFGQTVLMRTLEAAFAPHDIRVAQSLLTLDDTEMRRRWLNARATLDTILAAGGLPVVNENDTVATDEIRYGDNDRLAARVAQMVSADTLVLLSDVDGLYAADPRLDPGAEHVPMVREITARHDAMAGDTNSDAGVGSGGMATKLAAARIAFAAGCRTVITRGDRDHPLLALEQRDGSSSGARATWFVPPLSPQTARLAWLESHLSPEGVLTVDAGAARALVEKGASLLPVGVTGVAGQFERGAAVEVQGPDGIAIAKGVTAYASSDVADIAGLKSDAVADKLGWRGRPAIIHRDDLVILGAAE